MVLHLSSGATQHLLTVLKSKTGNFRISGNTIETTIGNFNVESATGEVNIPRQY